MNKFTHCIELRIVSNGLFNQIFHGFNVMVGGALNLFDAQRLLKRKISNQLVQNTISGGGKRCHFRNSRVLREMLQPANFDYDAVANQTIFTKHIAQ